MTDEYVTLAECNTNPELEQCTKLEEHMNNPLIVKSFDVIPVGENDCAIIETDKGKVSSFSTVIISQLKTCKEQLDQGKKLKLIPTKEKNYHKFVDLDDN
tara:strand:+ start:78 stop:377 length:300 start_codon:yes stop_codon:yes gene_type:complete